MRTRLGHAAPLRRPRRHSLRARVQRSRTVEALVVPDAAVVRARRAGGPLDEACYACACGCVFRAPVSTTVACPRCRAPQPW